jgi:hypothetical protein
MNSRQNTLGSLIRSSMILIEQAGREAEDNEKVVAFLNGAGALLSTVMDVTTPKEAPK